jgi:arylsulfatase A-like enzyme
VDSPVDGEDFTALLANPAEKHRKSPMFWHFPNVWTKYPTDRHVGFQPHSTIRSGDWKAIYFYDRQRWELYQLATDPGETLNLAEKEPARLTELATALSKRLTQLKSPLPIDRATGQPRHLQVPTHQQH